MKASEGPPPVPGIRAMRLARSGSLATISQETPESSRYRLRRWAACVSRPGGFDVSILMSSRRRVVASDLNTISSVAATVVTAETLSERARLVALCAPAQSRRTSQQQIDGVGRPRATEEIALSAIEAEVDEHLGLGFPLHPLA